MDIRNGTKIIKKNGQDIQAILEIDLSEYIIYVFEGSLSEFDILVKYKKDSSRIRTPKHIHWVVDILMKMQGNKELTMLFLNSLKNYWDNCVPLPNRNYDTIRELLEHGIEFEQLDEYINLNEYGEYSVLFLSILTQLLSLQEKTNRADAYMFGVIIDELLDDDIDLFSIVSRAGFTGRR